MLDILYTFDEYFIDKFWNSIQNNIWVYIDNEMLIWMGYSNYDIKKGKLSYSKILESNFEENIEYKHINNKEFNDISKSFMKDLDNMDINLHNRTTHIILSSKCFKKSLMMIRTEKANQIRYYYVDIEELCLEFNKYLLHNKDEELKKIIKY